MEIHDNVFQRGPGVWKLNNKLLAKQNYCMGQEKCITTCLQQCEHSGLDAIQVWEYTKRQCKENSIKFLKRKARNERTLLGNFHTLRDILMAEQFKQRHVKKTEVNKSDAITMVKEKIDMLEQMRVEKSIFRSRCTWARLGEKSNKYFFVLERRNYQTKTMFTIVKNNGEICKQQSVILEEQKKFYSELYTANNSVRFKLTNTTGIMLNENYRNMLDKDLCIDELYTALVSMKSEKVPGLDGLSKEWYFKNVAAY